MSRYNHVTGDRTTPNSNHVRDGTARIAEQGFRAHAGSCAVADSSAKTLLQMRPTNSPFRQTSRPHRSTGTHNPYLALLSLPTRLKATQSDLRELRPTDQSPARLPRQPATLILQKTTNPAYCTGTAIAKMHQSFDSVNCGAPVPSLSRSPHGTETRTATKSFPAPEHGRPSGVIARRLAQACDCSGPRCDSAG